MFFRLASNLGFSAQVFPPRFKLRKRVLFDRAATKRPRNEAPLLSTHPIFESDFDCLTGKNRIQATSLPSLSPLTDKKRLKIIQVEFY